MKNSVFSAIYAGTHNFLLFWALAEVSTVISVLNPQLKSEPRTKRSRSINRSEQKANVECARVIFAGSDLCMQEVTAAAVRTMSLLKGFR